MKQTNLYEFLNDLEEALKQELHKETGSEDITETDFEPEQSTTTPIERVILNFLKHCEAQRRVPTLDEAKSIYLLDSINSKYNKG